MSYIDQFYGSVSKKNWNEYIEYAKLHAIFEWEIVFSFFNAEFRLCISKIEFILLKKHLFFA